MAGIIFENPRVWTTITVMFTFSLCAETAIESQFPVGRFMRAADLYSGEAIEVYRDGRAELTTRGCVWYSELTVRLKTLQDKSNLWTLHVDAGQNVCGFESLFMSYPSPVKEVRLLLLRFGPRQYLIAEAHLFDFVMRVRDGTEPREPHDFSDRWGAPYFIASGGHAKSVGKDEPLILNGKPLSFDLKDFATVIAIDKSAKMATLDIGMTSGVRIGTRLDFKHSSSLWKRLPVVCVGATTCAVRLPQSASAEIGTRFFCSGDKLGSSRFCDEMEVDADGKKR